MGERAGVAELSVSKKARRPRPARGAGEGTGVQALSIVGVWMPVRVGPVGGVFGDGRVLWFDFGEALDIQVSSAVSLPRPPPRWVAGFGGAARACSCEEQNS